MSSSTEEQHAEFSEEDTVPDCSPESLDIVFNYDQLVRDRSKMHKITLRQSSSNNSSSINENNDDDERNTYYVGASNNFVRVFTLNGRKYWIAQALCYHRAPDHKIHFSVHRKDVPKAFNLIGKCFFESGMKFGMKAIMIDEETEVKHINHNDGQKLDLNWNKEGGQEGNDRSFTLEWPESMKGREITVYIYRYFDMTASQHSNIWEYDHKDRTYMKEYSIGEKGGKYDGDQFLEFISQPFKQFELTSAMEEPLRMYRKWIRKVEDMLERENIEPNGCADGDLPLGGKYASFRNETFIPIINNNDAVVDQQQEITPQSSEGENSTTFGTLKQNSSNSSHSSSSSSLLDANNGSADTDNSNVNDLFVYPPNFTGWNASQNPQALSMYKNLHLTSNETFDHVLDHLPLISTIIMIPFVIAWLS